MLGLHTGDEDMMVMGSTMPASGRLARSSSLSNVEQLSPARLTDNWVRNACHLNPFVGVA